jgi:hypothetical protein
VVAVFTAVFTAVTMISVLICHPPPDPAISAALRVSQPGLLPH